MGFQLVTTKGQLTITLQKEVAHITEVMINTLQYVGNEAVKVARTSHKYKDQTGNLTSSIGYVLSVNGEIITMSDFNAVKGAVEGTIGDNGSKTGKELAMSLAQHSSGITLILVAGMEYATFVEAMGLNVLEAAKITAEKLLKNILNQLGI